MSDDSRPLSDDSPGREPKPPDPEPGGPADGGDEQDLLTRFRTADEGPLLFIRESLTSVLAVAMLGLLLFAISGVWPPMVAVESGSMEPHMHKGDLVFITEPGRFAPDAAYDETGVVTYQHGKDVGYRTFGSYGSVIVYDNPGRAGPPVIHRARFWVNEGENWYDEANTQYVRGANCQETPNCPAPHAGFITKGDANTHYDQVNGISPPVKPDWITGIARVRVPYLGWIRLYFSGAATVTMDVSLQGSGLAATNGTVAGLEPGTGPGPEFRTEPELELGMEPVTAPVQKVG